MKALNRNITILAVLTALLLLLQARNTLVYLAFKSNQKFLIQTSCINRFDKNSSCRAHCQLYKKITESTVQPASTHYSFSHSFSFINQENCIPSFNRSFLFIAKSKTFYLFNYSASLLAEIIQPPD